MRYWSYNSRSVLLCESIAIVLHSRQLAEKELKGHLLQEELTHEQAVTREKESEVHERATTAVILCESILLCYTLISLQRRRNNFNRNSLVSKL